jgi:hypothetical protein
MQKLLVEDSNKSQDFAFNFVWEIMKSASTLAFFKNMKPFEQFGLSDLTFSEGFL